MRPSSQELCDCSPPYPHCYRYAGCISQPHQIPGDYFCDGLTQQYLWWRGSGRKTGENDIDSPQSFRSKRRNERVPSSCNSPILLALMTAYEMVFLMGLFLTPDCPRIVAFSG